MAAPRMRALVSESACACSDEAKKAAVTAGKAIMFESLSPTHRLVLILPLEPGNERLEILYDGRSVHLPLARPVSENLLPRSALSPPPHAGHVPPPPAVALNPGTVQ